MYKPPNSDITATAKVARAAVDDSAPNDVKNKITAIIKYVQGSMVLISFPVKIIEQPFRTNVLL